jgi:hypothetical protein
MRSFRVKRPGHPLRLDIPTRAAVLEREGISIAAVTALVMRAKPGDTHVNGPPPKRFRVATLCHGQAAPSPDWTCTDNGCRTNEPLGAADQ